MRKIFSLLIIVLFAVSFVFAEPVDKGSNFIQGEIDFQSQSGDLYENSDGDGVTAFGVNLAYGHFLIDQLAVGLVLGYGSMSQGDYKNSTLSIGPMVGYFFKLNSDVAYPFLSAAYLFNSSSWEYDTYDDKGSGSQIQFAGGMVIMMGDHLAFVPGIEYSMDSFEWDEDAESFDGSRFGVTIGLAGFLYK